MTIRGIPPPHHLRHTEVGTRGAAALPLFEDAPRGGSQLVVGFAVLFFRESESQHTAMAERRSLPHEPPLWVDPSREIWFITLCALPRGEAQLTLPLVSRAILDSVAFRWQREQWYPWIFLIMPDHCHALFSFPQEGRGWVKTIRDWKHWLAVKTKVRWQTDFHDHRLRLDESFTQKADYILHNPVRAGLVSQWKDWPHQWQPPDSMPFTTLPR